MDDWIAGCGLKAVTRERLRAFSTRSDLKGAVQAVSHIGTLAATTAALLAFGNGPYPLFIMTFIAQGMLLNCLYAGQHELSHWTVFRTKWLNDRLGEVFGFLTLNPFHADRWAHFAHHRGTQDPHRDSELIGMPPFTTTSYLLNLIGADFWWRRIRAILRAAACVGLKADYWLSGEERRFVVWEARGYVALWFVIFCISLATRSWLAVELWLGPLLLTKAFHQLQNTGEHTGMPDTGDIFTNTRTLKGPAPMRWVMWNMSYHTAHHTFPGVPFHALPRLHRAIVEGLGRPVIERGYLEAQRDIIGQLAAEDRARRVAA